MASKPGVTVRVRTPEAAEFADRMDEVEDALALADAHLAVAQVVRRYAQRISPRKTGRMANAHKIDNSQGPGVLVDVPYSGYVHGGTTVMPARPWVQESVVATEATWVDIYQRALDDAAREADM